MTALNDSVRFTIQNAGWTALHPIKASKTRKAMREYRKTYTKCEITGSTKKLQTHHIIPVWKNPELADDPNNFIVLSASSNIHHIFGHDCSFKTKYVSNIKEIAQEISRIKAQSKVVHR